jgi:mono/diheme cytochrome c family protein
MKKIKTLAILMILGTVASCESNTYDDIAGPKVENPTYAANVKQIVSNNCLSCHSVATNNQEPNLETYENLKLAVMNNGLLDEISAPSGEGMPEAGRLPQTEIDIITTWAAQGFVQQ